MKIPYIGRSSPFLTKGKIYEVISINGFMTSVILGDILEDLEKVYLLEIECDDQILRFIKLKEFNNDDSLLRQIKIYEITDDPLINNPPKKNDTFSWLDLFSTKIN